MSKLTAIDLFAGAGGATQGLRDAGYDVLLAIENEPTAAATFKANHEATHMVSKDIGEVNPASLQQEVSLSKGELTLLNACPPCQGFSTLGSNNEDDPRNELVLSMLPFVDEFEPKALILENVRGLKFDERLRQLKRALETESYGVKSYVVDAYDFGVPQHRRRLILLAFQDLDSDALPDYLSEELPADFDSSPQTAGQWIAKAGPIDQTDDPVHRARDHTPSVRARIEAIPVGGTRFDLPPEHQLECHKNLNRSRSAAAPYSRIVADEPAATLTTRCTTPSCGRFIHPTEHRGISLREAALLQTFPLEYRFIGNHGQVERQIGNALPVRLAEALGLVVAKLIADIT